MIEVIAEPIEMISGEILANGHRNGQTHQLADLYGPFLSADDIMRRNPGEHSASPMKLEVGDYLMRLTGSEPQKPNRHSRFILNALLSVPEGGLYTRILPEAGFFPESSSDNARSQAISNNVKYLEKQLNGRGYRVLERVGARYSLHIAISPIVEVVRFSDDDLREKIIVKTPNTNSHIHQNDNGATHNGNGHANGNGHIVGDGELRTKAPALLPQTQSEFIQVRDFEDEAYTGTRSFIMGQDDDMPIIETTQDLKRAKNALSSLAGKLRTELQKERYKLANELILEFTISEQEPVVLKSKVHQSGGEKNYPIGQEWRADAACLGMDPEYFHPARGESTKEAKAVCRSCDVQKECLELGLANGEKLGIWGGASERERRSIRKKRKLAAVTAE